MRYNSDFFRTRSGSLHSESLYLSIYNARYKPFDKIKDFNHKTNFLSILNDIGL